MAFEDSEDQPPQIDIPETHSGEEAGIYEGPGGLEAYFRDHPQEYQAFIRGQNSANSKAGVESELANNAVREAEAPEVGSKAVGSTVSEIPVTFIEGQNVAHDMAIPEHTAKQLVTNLEQSQLGSRSELAALVSEEGERLSSQAREKHLLGEAMDREEDLEEKTRWWEVRGQAVGRIMAVLNGEIQISRRQTAVLLDVNHNKLKETGFMRMGYRKTITAKVAGSRRRPEELEISAEHAKQARDETYALLGVEPPKDDEFDYVNGEFVPGYPSRDKITGLDYRSAEVVTEIPGLPRMGLVEQRIGSRGHMKGDPGVFSAQARHDIAEHLGSGAPASHWKNSEFNNSQTILFLRRVEEGENTEDGPQQPESAEATAA